jgi:hypothetical protein
MLVVIRNQNSSVKYSPSMKSPVKLILMYFLVICTLFSCSNIEPNQIKYWQDYHLDKYKTPLQIDRNINLRFDGKYDGGYENSDGKYWGYSFRFSENLVVINRNDGYQTYKGKYEISNDNILSIIYKTRNNTSRDDIWSYVGLVNQNYILINYSLDFENNLLPAIVSHNMKLDFISDDSTKQNTADSSIQAHKIESNENNYSYDEFQESLSNFLDQTSRPDCDVDEWVTNNFSPPKSDRDYANYTVSLYNYCSDRSGIHDFWETIAPNKKMKEISATVVNMYDQLYVTYNYQYSFSFTQSEIAFNQKQIPVMKKAMWDELYFGKPYKFHPDFRLGLMYNYFDINQVLLYTISFDHQDFVRGNYLE